MLIYVIVSILRKERIGFGNKNLHAIFTFIIIMYGIYYLIEVDSTRVSSVMIIPLSQLGIILKNYDCI